MNGNKSYIGFILLGLLGIAKSQGWINDELMIGIGSLVGTFTGVSMRHAIRKSETK